MNILEFVLVVWLGIVILAVGIDVGPEIWAEKRAAREEYRQRVREAESAIYMGIAKHLEERKKARTNVVELKVMARPQRTVGGRHRLTAA